MGNKQTKEAVDVIYTKYGQSGIKNILFQQNSEYRSLSQHKIKQICHTKIDQIYEQGNEVINEHIKLSQQDYLQLMNQVQKKHPQDVKKTEYALKQPFRQIIGLDEKLEGYQKIRDQMQQNFDKQRQVLQKSISKEICQHEEIDFDASYPEYHNLQSQQRKKLYQVLQDKYGKPWYNKEKEAREEGKPIKQIYQFNFTDNHKPDFQKLIPNQKCEELRSDIKKQLKNSINDSLDTKRICC